MAQAFFRKLTSKGEDQLMHRLSLRKCSPPNENQSRKLIDLNGSRKDFENSGKKNNKMDFKNVHSLLHADQIPQKHYRLEYKELKSVLRVNVPWWLRSDLLQNNVNTERLAILVEKSVERIYSSAHLHPTYEDDKTSSLTSYDKAPRISQKQISTELPNALAKSVGTQRSSETEKSNNGFCNMVESSTREKEKEISYIQTRLSRVLEILHNLEAARLDSGCEKCQRQSISKNSNNISTNFCADRTSQHLHGEERSSSSSATERNLSTCDIKSVSKEIGDLCKFMENSIPNQHQRSHKEQEQYRNIIHRLEVIKETLGSIKKGPPCAQDTYPPKRLEKTKFDSKEHRHTKKKASGVKKDFTVQCHLLSDDMFSYKTPHHNLKTKNISHIGDNMANKQANRSMCSKQIQTDFDHLKSYQTAEKVACSMPFEINDPSACRRKHKKHSKHSKDSMTCDDSSSRDDRIFVVPNETKIDFNGKTMLVPLCLVNSNFNSSNEVHDRAADTNELKYMYPTGHVMYRAEDQGAQNLFDPCCETYVCPANDDNHMFRDVRCKMRPCAGKTCPCLSLQSSRSDTEDHCCRNENIRRGKTSVKKLRNLKKSKSDLSLRETTSSEESCRRKKIKGNNGKRPKKCSGSSSSRSISSSSSSSTQRSMGNGQTWYNKSMRRNPNCPCQTIFHDQWQDVAIIDTNQWCHQMNCDGNLSFEQSPCCTKGQCQNKSSNESALSKIKNKCFKKNKDRKDRSKQIYSCSSDSSDSQGPCQTSFGNNFKGKKKRKYHNKSCDHLRSKSKTSCGIFKKKASATVVEKDVKLRYVPGHMDATQSNANIPLNLSCSGSNKCTEFTTNYPIQSHHCIQMEKTVPKAEDAGASVPCPVACPVTCPVACPVTCPVACPLTCPVACPLTCPVACPLTCPVDYPVACPVACPVVCPVACPEVSPASVDMTCESRPGVEKCGSSMKCPSAKCAELDNLNRGIENCNTISSTTFRKCKSQEDLNQNRSLSGQSANFCEVCIEKDIPLVTKDLAAVIRKIIGNRKRNSVFVRFTMVGGNLFHLQLCTDDEYLGCLYATEEATIEARDANGFDGLITISVTDACNSYAEIDQLVDLAFIVVQNENRSVEE